MIDHDADRRRAVRCGVLQYGLLPSFCDNRVVEIRSATDADADALAMLHNALIGSTTIEWTETPHDGNGMLAWLRDHDEVFVAEDDDGLAGFAAYGPFRDIVKRPGYRFTVENSIHIRQDCWGTGLGRRLMERVIEAARAAGKHTMVAAVDGENEGSVRFHERLGFVEVGRMPQLGEKFGRWLDLVLLQRHLDDRATPGGG